MNDENDRLRAYVEERRGRPLTLAERNIDIAGLNRDLQDGKAAIRDAVAKAQADAARTWVRRGMRGDPRLRVTPELEKLIGELYDKGAEHASGELGRAGVRGYAKPTRDGKRMAKLLTQLAALLGGVNARMRKTATELDLSTLSRNAIADALAKVPGALDVASRMVSPAVYAGLGATFDRASAQVDVADAPAGTGGNGWEYTAVMDAGTCDPCAEHEGEQYDTWDAAQDVLPDGGPNPDCDGDTRCRCRLAPVPLA